jgi:tetratricopeptide (TPR) repeat protein
VKPATEKDSAPTDPATNRRGRVVAWFVRDGRGPRRKRVRWMRVLGWLGGLTVAGYVAAALAAFGFVRYVRHVEAVAFTDILLPSRWDHYRVARGDQQIAEAKRLVEERKFAEGFLYARAGVASAPGNRDGRLLWADLLVAARQPDNARRALLDGLRYHAADPVYVKAVVTFLLQRQEDGQVVALARRLLPAAVPGSAHARLWALAAGTASVLRGNYDQAEDFLRAVPRLADSREGRLLSAKLEWDRGYRELALVQFRQLASELPQDAEVHRELLGHLRQQGLMDEARRRSLERQIAFPKEVGPRIELLHTYRQAGEAVRVAREADALLRDFAGDSAALLSLADFAANVGDVALMRRTVGEAAARGMELDPFALLRVETLVVARDFQGAVEAIRGYRAEFPAGERTHAGVLDSLQAAALLGLGDDSAATMFLNSFLGQADLRADNLLAVANRLADLGAVDAARRTLARAVELDPLNQAALTRLVEVEVMLNAGDGLAVHVQRLIRLRRPSPDILRVAQLKLGSDLFLFSEPCKVALEAVRAALARLGDGGAPR